MVTTPAATQVKLGKLPARVDPRTLSLARYVEPQSAPRTAAGARPRRGRARLADVRETTGSATARRPPPRT